MLIQESDMMLSTDSLLESMNYLTEAETQFHPQLVPVVENSRIGANIIALEDIDRFCESNGITDLGYAVNAICEASHVDPSSVVFSAQETSIIEGGDIAHNAVAIMNEGVPVYAVPISPNDSAYKLAEMACNALAYKGDESLLEAFVNDDMNAFVEAVNSDPDNANNYGTFGDAEVADIAELKKIAKDKDVNWLTRKVAAIKAWALKMEKEASGKNAGAWKTIKAKVAAAISWLMTRINWLKDKAAQESSVVRDKASTGLIYAADKVAPNAKPVPVQKP